jgi:hypothetical protein
LHCICDNPFGESLPLLPLLMLSSSPNKLLAMWLNAKGMLSAAALAPLPCKLHYIFHGVHFNKIGTKAVFCGTTAV